MAGIDFKAVSQMSLGQLLAYQPFKTHFMWLYNECNKDQDYFVKPEAFYEQQIGYLKRILMENEFLAKSTTLSICTSMIDVAYHGLSVEPISKPMAYLMPDQKNKTKMAFVISPYGELELRRRNGIITQALNPIMVYEGDIYEKTIKTVDGRTKIDVVHKHMRQSEKITDAFIILRLPSGIDDVKTFSMAEILAFKEMNKNEAMRKSKMWTGGFGGQPMRGTIEAKVIKHALSTYPRLNMGLSKAKLMSDIVDNMPDAVDKDAAYATIMAGASDYDEMDNETSYDRLVDQQNLDAESEGEQEVPQVPDPWALPEHVQQPTPPTPPAKKETTPAPALNTKAAEDDIPPFTF